MATDLSKLATEMQKGFPKPKPNGTFAPPPSAPKPLPDIGDIYQIIGINNKPSK
jgi:hypothetical protein